MRRAASAIAAASIRASASCSSGVADPGRLPTVGVSRDHRIRLSADGVDEDAAIEALVGLIASGRGETPAA